LKKALFPSEFHFLKSSTPILSEFVEPAWYRVTFYSAKFLICVYSRNSMSRSKLVSTVTRLLVEQPCLFGQAVGQ